MEGKQIFILLLAILLTSILFIEYINLIIALCKYGTNEILKRCVKLMIITFINSILGNYLRFENVTENSINKAISRSTDIFLLTSLLYIGVAFICIGTRKQKKF